MWNILYDVRAPNKNASPIFFLIIYCYNMLTCVPVLSSSIRTETKVVLVIK